MHTLISHQVKCYLTFDFVAYTQTRTGVVLKEDRPRATDREERELRVAGRFDDVTYWNHDTPPNPADRMPMAVSWLPIAAAVCECCARMCVLVCGVCRREDGCVCVVCCVRARGRGVGTNTLPDPTARMPMAVSWLPIDAAVCVRACLSCVWVGKRRGGGGGVGGWAGGRVGRPAPPPPPAGGGGGGAPPPPPGPEGCVCACAVGVVCVVLCVCSCGWVLKHRLLTLPIGCLWQ